VKIDLLHLKQEQDHTCVPACIRIVLRCLGHDFSEPDIGVACKTTSLGTELDDAVQGVSSMGFKAIKLKDATFDDIIRFVESHHPLIVFLSVNQLPYGGQAGMHAVVVNGFEKNDVSFVDPERGEEIVLTLGTFLKAWQARRCLGLVIEPL